MCAFRLEKHHSCREKRAKTAGHTDFGTESNFARQPLRSLGDCGSGRCFPPLKMNRQLGRFLQNRCFQGVFFVIHWFTDKPIPIAAGFFPKFPSKKGIAY
jgi:hypothetical protein